jgi:hypothetical protein
LDALGKPHKQKILMTDPTQLSPAAQAVLDAFNREARPEPHHQLEAIAAALRAAADQCAEGATHWELYAIAAELENAQ